VELRSTYVVQVLLLGILLMTACGSGNPEEPETGSTQPEHQGTWGIYSFEPATGFVELIYSSENSIHGMSLNGTGSMLAFRHDYGPDMFTDSEICIINSDGGGFKRLTDNGWMDGYPCWSPDGTELLFLSWVDYPVGTMDIYLMDPSGSAVTELYDSGFHDGDCHWLGSSIVFTRESQIWIMDDDGTDARQLTDFELAGQQGAADLPFGDYDPRIDPTGTIVSFDRMVDDANPSGNWDFYTILVDGTGETAVTNTGWQQFIAEWSHSGARLVFLVAAMGGGGIYDIYTIGPNGGGLENLTPSDWPTDFLCTHPLYSPDDSLIYFVGQWWR